MSFLVKIVVLFGLALVISLIEGGNLKEFDLMIYKVWGVFYGVDFV